MAQPGETFQLNSSVDDSFLELLVDTLEGLEDSVRAQFLRQFLSTIAQIDLTDVESKEYWARILQRRSELAGSGAKSVSLQTAIVDVLSTARFFRLPILIEYKEFKKLQTSAATDALTGLYNRRLFDEYCERELNRAKRYGNHLAVAILDLHMLKDVNDRHGHLQGDQVLQLAAVTLRKTLRASDLAFRIGGDEFAVLLPQTDPEQAITLCRRLRSDYEAVVSPLKLDIGVTLDFGVAVYPQDGDQKTQLMSLADKRLYELKHSGRTTSRVIPLENPPMREAPPPDPSTPLKTDSPVPAPSMPTTDAPYVRERKWERVSLAGTKAFATLTGAKQQSAKVIDLSYGGVALLMEGPEELPDQFNAVLHVPILPPVRVILHKAYASMAADGLTRIGCSFVS
jgi:diguanylate cyclase (GGDEF)-like protein